MTLQIAKSGQPLGGAASEQTPEGSKEARNSPHKHLGRASQAFCGNVQNGLRYSRGACKAEQGGERGGQPRGSQAGPHRSA